MIHFLLGEKNQNQEIKRILMCDIFSFLSTLRLEQLIRIEQNDSKVLILLMGYPTFRNIKKKV